MSSGSVDEVVLPLSSSSLNSYSINRSTHVSYSCGSCGYELNLNSCNRDVPVIDAEYGKSMKRGVISFFSIDESRFTQINKVRWLPYIPSKKSWRLFQRRTKLLCRNCGSYIGTAWNVEDRLTSSPSTFQLPKQSSATWDGISSHRMYEVKIRSLRPLSVEGLSTFSIQQGL